MSLSEWTHACKADKLPEPIFEEYVGGFQLTFFNNSDKSVDKSVDKIKKLIAENKFITQKEIAERTGLSVRGVEKNISKLKKEGIIKRIGSKKTGYWEIIK